MVIKFYINNSENEKVNKNITYLFELDGVLRSECDVKSPNILVEGDACLQANYVYIPEFNRYYYYRKPPSSYRTGMWIIDLDVDVLMSFKNEIKNCIAIINKQEDYNNANNDIDDGSFVFESGVFNEVVNFPVKFNDDGEYILLTAGGV